MSDITTLDAGRDDGLRTIGHISYALHAVVAVGAVLPGFQPGVALLVVVLLAPNGLLSLWRQRGEA